MSKKEIKTTDYAMFLQKDDTLQAVPTIETHKKLPSGAYMVEYNPMKGLVAFKQMNLVSDEIVDLPGGEYAQVMDEIDVFFSEEARARFKECGLLPKNNILLHGTPGAGKTCIVNKLAQKVVAQGGVVLFNPSPNALPETYRIFDSVQPETTVLIIMEELDEQIKKAGEGPFLHFLDGEIQKENAIYVATTNYLERIPERIRRCGRFPVLLEVGMPKLEAREFYLNIKLKNPVVAKTIAAQTDGFSIDMLKEVVRLNYCLGKDLEETLARVAGRAVKSKKPQVLGGQAKLRIGDHEFALTSVPGSYDPSEEDEKAEESNDVVFEASSQ